MDCACCVALFVIGSVSYWSWPWRARTLSRGRLWFLVTPARTCSAPPRRRKSVWARVKPRSSAVNGLPLSSLLFTTCDSLCILHQNKKGRHQPVGVIALWASCRQRVPAFYVIV